MAAEILGDYDPGRILKLAAEVADSPDKKVPVLLLELRDILDMAPAGSPNARKIRLDIWTYDLLQVLVLVLKQDFSTIHGGWATAVKLSQILSTCCAGLDPPETNEFYDLTLPSATDNLLILSRRIQVRYDKIEDVSSLIKLQLLKDFRSVLDSISWLISPIPALIGHLLHSQYLLQMLLTDDVETSRSVMSLIQNAVHANPTALRTMEEKFLFSLLDEFVYKLSASTDSTLGRSATRTILDMTEAHPAIVEILCARFKGLRPLLGKWSGKGFEKELRELTRVLDAGTVEQVESQKLHDAARKIQAMYRGYRMRTQLKKANKALSTLQRSFRKKRANKEKEQAAQKQQAELKHLLRVRRQRALREARRKELYLMESLPAPQVNKHISQQQKNAAIKIQKIWRGHNSRKKFQKEKDSRVQYRAASLIQRQVRLWLERRRRAKLDESFMFSQQLSDERRVELQGKIREYREMHAVRGISREKLTEQHENAHSVLQSHMMRRAASLKADQRRRVLLAALDTDAEMMIAAPKLGEATEEDIQLFSSKSVPVAAKARHSHAEHMRAMNLQWYQKLGDEFQDGSLRDDLEENNAYNF
ncbi:IQ calmodulin-binding motif-containing protein 1-like [Branchiostoma floridae x Branchiostoma belcheri]